MCCCCCCCAVVVAVAVAVAVGFADAAAVRAGMVAHQSTMLEILGSQSLTCGRISRITTRGTADMHNESNC